MSAPTPIARDDNLEASAATRASGGAATGARSDYCVFERDGNTFAVSTAVAREIVDPRPFTPVPQAPADLAGAFSLRGEVVPLVRIDRLLGVPGRIEERSGTLLILADEGMRLAAIVDRVHEIKHIPPWQIHREGQQARGNRPWVRGVATIESAAVTVLDGEQLLRTIAGDIQSGLRTTASPTPGEAGTSVIPEGGEGA